MESSNDQPVDAGVRFAPRLTEDSLPVTLPKDAEKSAEAPSASPEAPLSFEPEDKPVCLLESSTCSWCLRYAVLICAQITAEAATQPCTLCLQLRELQIRNQQLQQVVQQKDAELLALQ